MCLHLFTCYLPVGVKNALGKLIANAVLFFSFFSSPRHGWPVAADGPGDRFIMGECQAGQQVSTSSP